MQIKLNSVLVDDQDKALRFYTDVLGFVKKQDLPMGEYRWLTVVSPEGPEEIELLLEPMAFAPAQVYQKALFAAGIPLTAFFAPDLESEYARLIKRGVAFQSPPADMDGTRVAVFDDTCGNWIQLYQKL